MDAYAGVPSIRHEHDADPSVEMSPPRLDLANSLKPSYRVPGCEVETILALAPGIHLDDFGHEYHFESTLSCVPGSSCIHEHVRRHHHTRREKPFDVEQDGVDIRLVREVVHLGHWWISVVKMEPTCYQHPEGCQTYTTPANSSAVAG